MVQWRLQVVQPRYAEAIRLASQALEESSSIKEAPRPLPYMYGSPEYLQVWQQAHVLPMPAARGYSACAQVSWKFAWMSSSQTR